MNIVISGPGGVGKGTIVERLVARDDRLWLSRSWTTRDRRPSEPEDAYVFVDRASFEAHVEAGGFLEWVEFLDYLQGSPVPTAPEGVDVLFEIDTTGAAAVREFDPGALCIFVDAPSRDEQRERLLGRGDPPADAERRVERAEREAAAARELGSHLVVNEDLDDAVAEIEALIAEHRRTGT